MAKKYNSIGKFGKKQTYFRHNYIEYVKSLVPGHEEKTYYDMYGEEQDESYVALGAILLLAADATNLFSVSDTTNGGNWQASSYRSYFVPENKRNTLTSDSFYKDILRPLNGRYVDHKNEAAFRNYLISSVLPNIHTNNPTTSFIAGASSLASGLDTASGVHNYLADKLGILYFMNTSGNGVTVDPSSFVASALAGFAFSGSDFSESDAIGVLYDYIWTNRADSSALNLYLPPTYRMANSEISGLTYASGTQLIDGLKTLISVFYDDSENNEYIKDSLDLIVAGGTVPNRKDIGGPFYKFLKAVSYAFYDYKSVVSDLADLLDIEKCPPQFLDYLASYIGWKLVSSDIDSWRSQLRQAIYIYKSKGTRKSLESALKLVFPQGIYDPTDSVSGLVESWESYVPNMIYYFLRTESYLSREEDEIEAIKDYYQLVISNSLSDKVVPNIKRGNIDETYRFLVDYVLQRLDEKIQFIKLNGVHYTNTEFWTKQGEGAHYFHRGAKIYVPPWEISRFYDKIPLSDLFLYELKKLLIAGRNEGGFEVPETYVNSLISLLNDSKETTTQSQLPLGLADNGRFKVFSRTHILPPNYQQVLDRGNTDHMSLFDFYNSKSSHVFVQLDANSFDFTYKDFNGLGDSAINVISDLFHRFAPFHVALRIYLLHSFDDTKDTTDLFCLVVDQDVDEHNSTVLNSNSVSGFTWVSGLGLSSTNIRKEYGRLIPTTSGVFIGNLNRTNFRRRNYKNVIPIISSRRNGLSNPIGMTQYSLSAIKDSDLYNTTHFMAKGFNYSSQDYNDVTGSVSSVWDTSNNISIGRAWITDVSNVYNGIPVSSTWPIRGVTDQSDSCSSSPTLRTHSVKPIIRVIIDELIRRNDLDFSNTKIENFEFGEGIHRLYDKLDTFSSVHLIVDPPGQTYNPFGGGYNLISHVYGPLVFNGGFESSGIFGLAAISGISIDPFNLSIEVQNVPIVKYVAAPTAMKEISYLASGGSSVNIDFASLADGVLNSYISDIDKEYTNTRYSSRGILSGVEISCDNNRSFAIANREGSVYNSGLDKNRNSISLYKYEGLGPNEGVILRFPLERYSNRILNGKMNYSPKGLFLEDPETSSLANWSFIDSNYNSAYTGNVSLSSYTYGIGNQPSAIVLAGSGTSQAIAKTYAGGLGKYDFRSPQPLHPNSTYRLEFSAGNSTSGNLLFSFMNDTRNESYNLTTQTWDSGVVSNSYTSLVDGGWTKYSYDITIPDDHSSGDSYSLLYSVSGGNTAASTYFADVVLSSTTDNTFEYKQDYEGHITARFAAQKGINFNSITPILQVRIITNVYPHIGFGNVNNILAFNFDTRKWENATDSHWKDFELASEEKDYSFLFETRDNINKYQSYYVEIRPKLGIGTPTEQACITISDVSIHNIKYNEYIGNYSKLDTKIIMDFFSDLAVGSHSRSTTYTTDLGTSGGTRHTYLDYPVSGSTGFDFRDNDY